VLKAGSMEAAQAREGAGRAPKRALMAAAMQSAALVPAARTAQPYLAQPTYPQS
jgi:hypothetical protein